MEQDPEIYDVLIVGAGPCGLAVAARLAETTPSALFTDSEHQRYHWMKKHNLQTRKPQKVSRRSNTVCDRLLTGKCHAHTPRLKLAVLDAASEEWMGSWDRKFDDLSISHLRSPMFFHPDPRDRDGLLGYTYLEKRERELVEIKGVVGKGLSKHQRKLKSKNSGKQEVSYLDERERNDYFRPSASLFKHYCGDIVSRYQLHNAVQKAEVQSVAYDESESLFTVHTSTGVKYSRIVVFAVGAALKPSLPCDCPLDGEGSVTHAFKQDKVGLPSHVLAKIQRGVPTNVVVVGGGLTSAQIVDMAVKAGVTKVWHLMRGPLKVKHFDVSLEWVGKYKNFHLAEFWTADSDEERFEMIRTARNGGSITPEYQKILVRLISTQRCSLHENTTITSGSWCPILNQWTLSTSCSELSKSLPKIDHIIYATGLNPDFAKIPAVQGLLAQERFAIDCIGGMPRLTQDLAWSEELPFFVTGRLAGLRLGPGAGNLEGARMGAERIAWKIGELLERGIGEIGDPEDYARQDVDGRRLGLGIRNQFDVFDEDHDEDDDKADESDD